MRFIIIIQQSSDWAFLKAVFFSSSSSFVPLGSRGFSRFCTNTYGFLYTTIKPREGIRGNDLAGRGFMLAVLLFFSPPSIRLHSVDTPFALSVVHVSGPRDLFLVLVLFFYERLTIFSLRKQVISGGCFNSKFLISRFSVALVSDILVPNQ